MQALAARSRCMALASTGSRVGGGSDTAAAAAGLRCTQQSAVLLGSRQDAAVFSCTGPHRRRLGCSRLQQARHPQHLVLPRAAADAGAAANDGPGGRLPPPVGPLKPKRELSLQQRWRAVKFAALETQQRVAQQLSQVPAVAALLQLVAAVNQRLQPVYDAWQLVQKKQEQTLELYDEFLADETKRQWQWSKRYEKEMAWWSSVPPFLGFFAATVAYQAFMPVSFLVTVALPLYYSWVLWDQWWVSPIFLATLFMTPLKWVPWADKCLVWPGLI